MLLKNYVIVEKLKNGSIGKVVDVVYDYPLGKTFLVLYCCVFINFLKYILNQFQGVQTHIYDFQSLIEDVKEVNV